VRRNSRKRSAFTFKISSLLKINSPLVGSIKRVMHRTKVDLPEPDRPITTKTSFGATSNETSLTAMVLPVLFRSSVRLKSASGVPINLSALGPKTFQRFRTEIIDDNAASVSRQSVGVRKPPRSSRLIVGPNVLTFKEFLETMLT